MQRHGAQDKYWYDFYLPCFDEGATDNPIIEKLDQLGDEPQICSSTCKPQHQFRKTVKHKQNYDVTKGSHVLMLKMQIKSKIKSIEAFEGLVETMRHANYGMRAEISKLEKDAYTRATKDLERGCAYLIGGKLRKEYHVVRMKAMKQDLEATKIKTEREIAVLEQEIATKEAEINSTKQDLMSLHSYRDKEYPVKLLEIKKLNYKLDHMNSEHVSDSSKINDFMCDEMSKLDGEVLKMALCVVDRAAERVFSEKGESAERMLKNLAINNKQLRHEISKQKNIIQRFEREVKELEDKNDDMITNKLSSVRNVAFQDVLGICKNKKFLPDDELVLDIPLPKMLPI